MILAQFASGIALTIFGVRFFRKGLDRLFGGKLVELLSRLTDNPWKGFASGILVGALAPSSTALALVTLQLLNAGKITAERILAVLLGANVGMTVTVQLLAFRVQDYAGFLICAGVFAFQFLKREIFRGIGQCLLALGFIFLAMQLIGKSAAVWKSSPEIAAWLQLLEGHPFLILIAVALLTFCMQSSTASIGLALAFAGSGLLREPLVIPWVTGANLGVSITALVAGWSSLEGRRLSLANLLSKALVALPFLTIPAVAGSVTMIWHSLPREIAMFHTGFNLLVGIIILPFLKPLIALTRWMITPAQDELRTAPTYLDAQALDTPSLALANATRETLQMADGIKVMLSHFWKGYMEHNLRLSKRVQLEDDMVDDCYRRIKNYLNSLREGMTEGEARWQFALLTFANELEGVGDIVDKHLCDSLQKLLAEETRLTPEDELVIGDLNEKVQRRFDVAVSLLTTRDPQQAKDFVAGKETLNEWCRRAQKEHYDRLKLAGASGIAASSYFLEMLNGFRRINSHLTAIGYAFSPAPAATGRKSESTRRRRASGGGVSEGTGASVSAEREEWSSVGSPVPRS